MDYVYGIRTISLDAITCSFFLGFFFSTSFVPCGKFGLPYLGKVTAAARAALPIPNSAYGIFLCPNKGMAAIAWDL